MTPVLFPDLAGTRKCSFLPSGIEHPAFRRQRGGRIRYLLCWKPVLQHVAATGEPGSDSLASDTDLFAHQVPSSDTGQSTRQP